MNASSMWMAATMALIWVSLPITDKKWALA
jgi:hypothetical protein